LYQAGVLIYHCIMHGNMKLKKKNIQFTYRHSNYSRRLLPAARQWGSFSRVDPLIEHFPG